MDNDEEVKHFWDFVEEKLGNCKVPKYLKNILYLTGHDNIGSIKNISNEDIEEIEVFVRTGMTTLIAENANHRDYYHFYSARPESFQIPLGHKRLLQLIVELMNTEDFQIAYFKVREVEKRQVRAARANTSGAPFETEKTAPENQVFSESDLEEERKKLFKKITSWLQKNCVHILEKYEVNLDMVIMKLNVNVVTNVSEMMKDVICPVCKKSIKIVETKTVLAGGSDQFHFLISNFTRHVQKIHIMKPMSSSMAASQVRLTPYFIKEGSDVSPVAPAEGSMKITTLNNPDFDENSENTNLRLQFDLEFHNQEETEEYYLLEKQELIPREPILQETIPIEDDSNELGFTSFNRAFKEMQVEHVDEFQISEVEHVDELQISEVEHVDELQISEVENVDELQTSEFEHVEELQISEVEHVDELPISEVEHVDELQISEVEHVDELQISEVENVITSDVEDVNTLKVGDVITSEVGVKEAESTPSKRVFIEMLQVDHDVSANCPKIEIRKKRKYTRQTTNLATNGKNDIRKIRRKNQK